MQTADLHKRPCYVRPAKLKHHKISSFLYFPENSHEMHVWSKQRRNSEVYILDNCPWKVRININSIFEQLALDILKLDAKTKS